jgi:hypothetical protein
MYFCYLPVDLHGRETWYLAVREDNRFGLSGVLKREYLDPRGRMWEEVEKMHTEDFRKLYPSSNIWVAKQRRMRLAGHVVGMGDIRNEYKIVVREPEREMSPGRIRPIFPAPVSARK